MREDLEVLVKSDVDHLNCLVKPANFEKFQKISTLELFQTISAFEISI